MQAKEWQRAGFSQITLVPPSKNHLSKPKTTNKILFFDVEIKSITQILNLSLVHEYC
jgi:hypothetical protein